MRRRVVVTGMGTVNPLGNDVTSFWEGIKAGRSGVRKITRFETDSLPVKVAAEVKDFDPEKFIEKRDARKMALFTQYAVASAVQAMADAGMAEGDFDPERLAIIVGNGIGGQEINDASQRKLFESSPDRILPMTIPMMIMNEAPANIAIRFKAHGPTYAIATACASGTDAIGVALDAIRLGRTDMAITGGTEAAITPFGVGGFIMLKTLSTRYNDEPERASRPFDAGRDGFVIGEGAGMLVLEEYERAKKRGARIYGELAGYGASCDAYHLTSPDPSGAGGALAVKRALEDAGLEAGEIDYFNAHGTSTPVNDPIETKMIKLAFGDHAHKMKVSSTKSMTGHCIGAAGAVEAIICLLAMRDGFYPPTINLEVPDPECDLDYVPNVGVRGDIGTAMSCSLGFGGHNGMLIFRRT